MTLTHSRTFVFLFLLFGLGLPFKTLQAQKNDSTFITLHFLYGSKPKREFSQEQKKWFGGKWGGHVGIELDSAHVIDFVPEGKFHWIEHQERLHSRFLLHDRRSFWQTFGTSTSEVKKLSIRIPVSQVQKQRLDSLAKEYASRTPYDYAFLGMRCAAASYDLLAQAGIMKEFGHRRTWFRYFYPKRLRVRMIRHAREEGWELKRESGTNERKWEQDPPGKR